MTVKGLFPGLLGSLVVKRASLGVQRQMQEAQVRSLGHKDPLEKGIATPSTILA